MFSIATGPYIDYWTRLYSSALIHQRPEDAMSWTLFTDQNIDEMAWSEISDQIPVETVQIERQGWPGDTERRYELMATWLSNTRVADELLVYIDSDMLIHDALDWKRLSDSQHTLFFVRHPGYYRAPGRMIAYLRHPRRLVGDLVNWARFGGKFPGGAWENNRSSSACVPRRLRRRYICGGVWFGMRREFEALVNELALMMRSDLERGVHAKWHDESFLNWFYVRETEGGAAPKVLGPRFCWDHNRKDFLPLNPIIEAVDKGSSR